MNLRDSLKRSFIGKICYWIPGLAPAYHFALAFLGAARYGFPSEHFFVIGITGTKGKTSTIEILNAILECAGKSTALLSSLRVKVGGVSEKNMTGNTMPGRFFIQRFFSRALRERSQYALIEVTSQGISLSRHRFIRFRIGALTNIAPEHIEAHGSFEKYRAAKLAFLETVARHGGEIFLNSDDEHSKFYIDALQKTAGHVVRASVDDPLIESLARRSSPMMSEEGEASLLFFSSPVNQANAAMATAIARRLGIGNREIEVALRAFRGIPGRMEYVRTQPFRVVIDYAHTPDSLEAVYRDLRAKTQGKLICILGSAGGGRDKWKRPAMGGIAGAFCDHIILTDEDPYDEDPAEILREIESGIPDTQKQYVEKIIDRRAAIERAITLADRGDTVIMTGKGSEAWIHGARGKKIPWDERKAAESILEQK